LLPLSTSVPPSSLTSPPAPPIDAAMVAVMPALALVPSPTRTTVCGALIVSGSPLIV
jgi:hypothetical protein